MTTASETDTDASHPYPPMESVEFMEALSRHPGILAGEIATATQYIASQSALLVAADFIDIWRVDFAAQRLRNELHFDVKACHSSSGRDLSAEIGAQLFSFLANTSSATIDRHHNNPQLMELRNAILMPNGISSLLVCAIRVLDRDVGLIAFETLNPTKEWTLAENVIARGASTYLALAYASHQSLQVGEALRVSEARLNALSDNLPGALYQRTSALSAPFTFISSGVTRFCADLPVQLGLPDAIGWSHFVHPDDAPRVATAYATADTGTEYALEYRLRHPNGGEMWVLDRGRGTPGPSGKSSLDGVLFNITPRKKAEQKAEAAASLQRAILDNVSYSVISTDAKGTITFFNRAAEELLGYRAEELVGRQTPLIFHDLGEVQSRMHDAQRRLGRDILYPFEIFTVDALGGLPSESEWTYIRKDGFRLTIRLSVAAIRDDAGEITGFLGIASDISDRQALASRLRQSEEIASRILLQSPDAILITSMRDGRIIEANPGFEQITGISRNLAIGRSTIELNIWADPGERNAMIDAIRNDGEVTSLPIRVNQRAGSIRLCAMWARPFNFDGEPALLSVVHDVTELRLSVQAAQDAEKMLQTVLDAIPSRVFWKDRESVYLGCNRQFLGDAGISTAEDVIGKTDDDLPWKSKAEHFKSVDRRIMATGTPQLGTVDLYEMPAGPPRWFEVSKLPLIGLDGETKGILGIGSDVTEQRAALEQLRASEEKLRSLFESSPLGVTLTSVDGHFLEANDAFLKIVGYDRETIGDLQYQVLSPPEYTASDAKHVEILARTGRYGPYEKEYIRKDGSRITVSLNGSMVSGLDSTGYVWSTIEDITQRRAAENAQLRLKDDLARLVEERTRELKSAMEGLMRSEKLASLGSLVAGVAHEISTPVGNASLATSTMAGSIVEFENLVGERITRTSLDAFIRQVKTGTDIANRNIERVANLIQSFKQVAVDQTSSQRRTFQLTEVVDEIVTTMQPSLKRSAVQIDISVDGNIIFDSYPGPLGQILTNLINNSLIHAFPDKRSGTIRISADQPAGDSIRLQISDDGAGIPSAVLGRIFDPFFTSKLGSGGSGLGLHIVHNIATTVLGGSISVSSEEGHGTTFTLLLPSVTPVSLESEQ